MWASSPKAQVPRRHSERNAPHDAVLVWILPKNELDTCSVCLYAVRALAMGLWEGAWRDNYP